VLDRVVLALVRPDGAQLAGGGGAARVVHDVAGARGTAGIWCRGGVGRAGAFGSGRHAGAGCAADQRRAGRGARDGGAAVAAGEAAGHLVPVLYEIADDRDLPGAARGEDGRMSWRMRARHRVREVEKPVERAADADIAAVVTACRSARDRLIVLLMARAGLRRGEVAGLRRSDVHLLGDSGPLGCDTPRAHVHVVRRGDNPNGAWAKSRRQRVAPLDFLTVQVFDTYQFERMSVPGASGSDLVFVNLFRAPVGAPMRLDAVNDLVAAASRRAGIDPVLRPHQLRHAFGSNVADAGGGIDVIASLLGHASVSSSQVYVHPDPARLREAVQRVPSPRTGPAVTR